MHADEKKLFIRQVEVFAAYAAYNDHEIGRVIQAVEDMGKLDNTLIIYINGDNGTSAEGGLFGTPNEVAFFNGVNVPVDVAVEVLRRLGHRTDLQPYVGRWAWAFDTPFTWFKQIASHSAASVRAWRLLAGRIKDVGGIRNQFIHVIDVVPTILEVCGIRAPEVVDGIKQSADRRHELRLHLRREERQRAVPAQDAVLRDDGRPRHLSRRLDAEHQGRSARRGRPSARPIRTR